MNSFHIEADDCVYLCALLPCHLGIASSKVRNCSELDKDFLEANSKKEIMDTFIRLGFREPRRSTNEAL